MKARKRTLRASFVATFAAGAAALVSGCGAQAVERCGEAGVDGGRARACDDLQPGECPAALPAQGASCTVPAAVQCDYGRSEVCGGSPTHVATCSASSRTWTIGQQSCNPPRPVCPGAVPANGAACTPGAMTPCTYGDCGGQPTTFATCDPASSTWRVQQQSCNPPRPVCPAAAPRDGEPCGDPTAGPCNYGDCYGAPTMTAMCDTSTQRWQVVVSTCNPPPPMCPAAQPTTGSACDLPPGTSCGYGDCGGMPTATAVCDSAARTWAVSDVGDCAEVSDAGARD